MTGHTLYGVFDRNIGGHNFGIKPYGKKYLSEYMDFHRPVKLSMDFGWREVSHFQQLFRKSDIWDNFPSDGYTLITAEVKSGDENQRLDLLYLRADGGVLPCELKIGGSNKDAHGQLIRYLSDLYYQPINLEWLIGKNAVYTDKIDDETARRVHKEKFSAFISDNNIADPHVRLLPRTGLLIDEGFAPQALKAVRFLNGHCGFSIGLLNISTFVADDWVAESENYLYRIDIVDIQQNTGAS